jgi:hypothetical protein
MRTFNKQLLRIRYNDFPIDPEYVTSDIILTGFD